jgi:hypothetical protein
MFEQRKRKKLEKRRREVLSTIRGERLTFDEMVERAKIHKETPDDALLTQVHKNLADIEERAKNEADIDELDDLGEDAEEQGQLRAYVCPDAEIQNTGILVFDLMAEWNLPKAKLDAVQALLVPQLKDADKRRGALRDIFDQENSWRTYTSEYEDEMGRLTWWLFGATIILLVFTIVALHCFSGKVPVGLSILAAGAAGSAVSVMRKMPLLEVSLSGELESYLRRILSRVAVGVAASMIGSGFLGWGLLSISIHGLTFADVLSVCSTAGSCSGLHTLILLAVPMLFGFSERALTEFESKVFGNSGQGRGGGTRAVDESS